MTLFILFYFWWQITFDCLDQNGHYHIPLLLNPYGYTTYRGSWVSIEWLHLFEVFSFVRQKIYINKSINMIVLLKVYFKNKRCDMCNMYQFNWYLIHFCFIIIFFLSLSFIHSFSFISLQFYLLYWLWV